MDESCADEHRNLPAQFHFVLEGWLLVHDIGTAQTRGIEAPVLIAFPTANPNRIVASSPSGCRLLCCYVLPTDAVSAAIVRALPNPMVVDLRGHDVLRLMGQRIAAEAVVTRPGAHWTIASLARIAGMSRSAFAATFARVAGTTPQQFLSAVRFELGACLLAEGVPMKAVARAVGYASSSSFARSMRQSQQRQPATDASPPSGP